jgi:single-strand DNA-binding protein
MRSINKAVLLGNLAADPDEKVMPKGQAMVSFPLATNREYEQDGERKKSTDFHRVVIWGKLAQVAKQYLAKGSAVYVEGKIVNRSYADQGGDRRFITEIVADELNIITWKSEKEAPKTEGGEENVATAN